MNWAHYLLQVNLYLVVFYGFYKLLLDRETYFKLNRLYLLSAGILSLAIPFLRFEWFTTQPVAQKVYVGVDQLNGFMSQIIVSPEKQESISLTDTLVVVYLAGVLVATLIFLAKFCRALLLLRSPEKNAAFSFFGKKVVDQHMEGAETVNEHEHIHMRQLHSADIILFELIGVLLWFNPVIYAIKRTIRNIHEYLADEAAAHFQGNKDQYALLLMSKAMGVVPSALTNNFAARSMLKKRIAMLYKERSAKTAVLKYGFFVPLFGLALVLSSATIRKNESLRSLAEEIPLDAPVSTVKEVMAATARTAGLSRITGNSRIITSGENSISPDWEKFYHHIRTTIKYPEAARRAGITGIAQIKFGLKNGETRDLSIAGVSLGGGCDVEVMKSILFYPDLKDIPDGQYLLRVAFTLTDEDAAVAAKAKALKNLPGYTLLNTISVRGFKPSGTASQPEESSTEAQKEKAYDFVNLETQPTFPGGMAEFYNYIGDNIKYPQQARDNKIEGKVFLSFVVEKDGSLSDIKVERKLGYGTDEEAVRVISKSPRWIPGVQDGKKVRVKYNLPIAFNLSPSKRPPLANVESILGGKVAGIRINGSKSTDTNKTAQIRIGIRDLTQPLYIIDGVKFDNKPGPDGKLPSPLSAIKQEDIEAIQVLKDDDAIKAYGNAGKYGVIIVTTYSGSKKAETNKKKD